MAILKINNTGADAINPSYIQEKIKYILQPYKIKSNFWGGFGFVISDINNVIEQFYTVRKVWHKQNGIQLRHFILSFSEDFDQITPYQASLIAYDICDYFNPSYQIIFAVHEDTDQTHIHFLINTVNVITGKLFDMNEHFFYNFFNEVEFILKLHGIRYRKKPIQLFH